MHPPRTASRSRHVRRLLAALLAGAALALGLSPPALATPDPEQGFGLNVLSLVRSGGRFSPDQVTGFLGLLSRDGLRTARADALWAYVEPQPPQGRGPHRYDWAGTDPVAAQLARAGLRWTAVLQGSPGWASSRPGSLFAAPTPGHYPDFAAYAGAFAARYGSGGSFWAAHPELAPIPVQSIEIWNEPNTAVHWGTQPDPAAYASLFAQARAAIKAADPSAQVLIGGIVWNDDAAYLGAVLASLGPGVAIDGVGSHPYAPTAFSLIPNVRRMRGALDAAGRPDVQLYLNELGWPAAYDRPPSQFAVQGPVSDAARAATMALSIDGLSRSTCGVGNFEIYDAVQAEDNPQFVESLMGVYRRDGSSTQTSDALRDAVARYRASLARPGPVIPVCGARGNARTQLLPLRLTATMLPSGCTMTTVTYRGLPLEEAQVRVLRPYRGTKATDANGQGEICPPRPGGNVGLRIFAEVPGMASSNLVMCETATTCRMIGQAAACTLNNLKFNASRKVIAVVRRGLAARTGGCNPQVGDPVRLRTTLVLPRKTARRLGFAAAKKDVAVGKGSARLSDPGGRLTVRTKLTARARRALRRTRSVQVLVKMTATEAGMTDTVTRRVTLRG